MYARLLKGGFVIVMPVVFLITNIQSAFAADDDRRQIEEIVVTAERRESTISDTSISITAFTGEFLEDFGIRNQEDLQNMVPAAVIEPYDMAIRGVGRNFRSLGGDPGIATYLNGVYSGLAVRLVDSKVSAVIVSTPFQVPAFAAGHAENFRQGGDESFWAFSLRGPSSCCSLARFYWP